MQKLNYKKFKGGMLNILSKTDWCKDIVQLFNLRKLIIYLIITSLFAGYWYWQGLKNTQPEIDVGYKESITMLAPNGYEYLENLAINKPKDSNKWLWINSKTDYIYAKVKTGDIPESAKMRPYGFENRLIGFYGLGSGIGYTGAEAGIGYRFARLWQFRSEIIATNKGGYISASYKIKKFIFENTYIGVGIGKGYKGDDRGIIGFNVEF